MSKKKTRLFGFLALGLGGLILASFTYSTSSLLSSYGEGLDSYMWAGIGLAIELSEAVILILGGMAAYFGFHYARLAAVVMFIPLAMIGVLTLSGKLATIQDGLEQQRIATHGAFSAAQSKKETADAVFSSLSYTDLSAIQARIDTAKTAEAKALSELLRYASEDCTPKTNSRGIPYSTKAAELCGVYKSAKYEVSAAGADLATAKYNNIQYLKASEDAQNAADKLAAVSSGEGIKNNGVASQFAIGSKIMFGMMTPEQFRDFFIISVAIVSKILCVLLLYIGTKLIASAPAPTRLEREQARIKRAFGDTVSLQPLTHKPLENTPAQAPETAKVEGVEGLNVLTGSTATRQTKEQQVIIHPHTRRGDYNLIHGGEGTGKTLLMLEMAYTVANGGEMLGGAWRVDNPETVLFIDGENGQSRMNERIGKMDIKHPRFHYVSNDQLPAEHYPHIHEEHGQRVIEKLLKDTGASFLILDNLGVLGDEAQKSSVKWAAISNWMNRLNASGVTIWLVHHDKKDKGEFDGLSIIAKMPATRIHLTVHPKAQKGEVFINLAYKKHRDFYGDETTDKAAKFNGKRFYLVDAEDSEDTTSGGKPAAQVYDFGNFKQPTGTNREILQAAINAAGLTLESAQPVVLERSLEMAGICTAEGKKWQRGSISAYIAKMKAAAEKESESDLIRGVLAA